MFVRARQRKFLSLLIATVGVFATLAVAAPAAQAAPGNALPPIGAETPLSMRAADVPLTIRGLPYSVDLRGGMTVRAETNPNDPVNSVLLRVHDFRMTGELPPADRSGVQGGTITIEQRDVDEDSRSILKLIQKSPPRYEQVMVLVFTVTIDRPGQQSGPRAAHEPLVLTAKDPARLVGRLTQFPPRGDLLQLQNPVDLVNPDDPDVTVATIPKFPVKVGES